MKKSKILVSSILVIALCISLIAGTTLALFTSESNVNIAVTSGKVDVKATVTEGEHSSTIGGAAQGKAVIVGNDVTLEGIMPGDEFNFVINVTNNTTVAAKYRTTYMVEEGYLLASGLEVTVGGQTMENSEGKYKTYASAWGDTLEKTINVRIALPNTDSKIDNLYQGLSTKLSFAVEAVQANGVSDTAETVELLPEYTDAQQAFLEDKLSIVTDQEEFDACMLNGGYAILTGNLDLTYEDDGKFHGNVLYYDFNLDLNGYSMTTDYKFISIAALTISNGNLKISTLPEFAGIDMQYVGVITLENVNYDCSGSGMAGILLIQDAQAHIKNSTIKGEWYALCTNASAQFDSNNNVTIENSTLEAKNCGLLFNVPGTLTVKDSNVTAGDQGIFVRCGNATIEGCTIEQTNEYDGKYDNTFWGTGSGSPFAALVIGNRSKNAYRTAANVTVKETTLKTHESAYGVYMFGNVDASGNVETGLGATLEYNCDWAEGTIVQGDNGANTVVTKVSK